MNIELLMRPDLLAMQAYGMERNTENLCRLQANEQPFDPLPAYGWDLNRYPKPPNALLARLCKRYQVAHNQLMLTRGSDDGIDALIRLFISAGRDEIILCPPTFSMYAISGRIQGAKLVTCPLHSEDFSLNQFAIQQAVTANTKLLFLCRPNNPSGTMIALETVAALAEEGRNRYMVVVDEAYIEFSEQSSASSLLKNYQNLVVLRTCSKAYGLAGLRLGAVLADPVLIRHLSTILPPYTLPTPVTELALEALQEDKFDKRAFQRARQAMYAQLQTMRGIENVWPSEANFFLIQIRDSAALVAYMRKQGFCIKAVSPTLCRISMGNAEQNAACLASLGGWTL